MVVGQVIDQYAFFILNGMTDDYLEQVIHSIEESLYIETRLRMRGVLVDENITPYPDEGF